MAFENTIRVIDIFFKVLTSFVVLAIFAFFVALYSTKASRLVFSDSAVYQDGQRIDKVTTANACDESGSSCLEDVLLLQGDIDLGMLIRLYLTDLSTYSTVCLDSPGGSVPITKRIMAKIRSEKLNTCLARTYTFQLKGNSFKKSHSGCESACAIAFLSGTQRISIGSGLTLNVHASGVNGTTIHTDHLYEYVYPEPSFYCLLDIIKTVPNRTMRSISTEQASMFGVFTRSLGKSVGNRVLSSKDELVLPNLWNLPSCRESVLRL